MSDLWHDDFGPPKERKRGRHERPREPSTRPAFVDDRPEGGENDPIVILKDSGVDTDPKIDWGFPRPNDLDIVRKRIGEEAIKEAEAGLKEASRRLAYVREFRTEPRDSWDESLEDVE